MSVDEKNTTTRIGFGSPIYSDQVKNYDNDPLVQKKVKKAQETLKRVGLPVVKANRTSMVVSHLI